VAAGLAGSPPRAVVANLRKHQAQFHIAAAYDIVLLGSFIAMTLILSFGS